MYSAFFAAQQISLPEPGFPQLFDNKISTTKYSLTRLFLSSINYDYKAIHINLSHYPCSTSISQQLSGKTYIRDKLINSVVIL
jgi:hypothetical protein